MGDAGGPQPPRASPDALDALGTQQPRGPHTERTTSQTNQEWQKIIDILSSLKADLEEEEESAQKWERAGKPGQAIRRVHDLREQTYHQPLAKDVNNGEKTQLDRIETGMKRGKNQVKGQPPKAVQPSGNPTWAAIAAQAIHVANTATAPRR